MKLADTFTRPLLSPAVAEATYNRQWAPEHAQSLAQALDALPDSCFDTRPSQDDAILSLLGCPL
jgi:hypothetical protein